MDFSELLVKRRSVRAYADKEVSKETIMEIIGDACKAPSASNDQPWRFIAINDRDLMKRISDESKANILADVRADPDHGSKKYEAVLGSNNFNVFYNAPCMVMIVGLKESRSVYVDCSLAACYFMMSATSRGLGTCWVNLGSDIRDPKLLEEIGMPDDCVIVAPVILGYPTAIPNPSPRNEPVVLKYIS